jgi:hypothetical protein
VFRATGNIVGALSPLTERQRKRALQYVQDHLAEQSETQPAPEGAPKQ